MIRVTRPPTPAVLTSHGAKAATDHCDAFDATPEDYRTGTKKFEFDSGIYAAAVVKAALRDAQHGKCAFCESYFVHVAYGDVEHFRPKGAFKQRPTDALRYPGYYWLAYEWGNLFHSCQLCNQRFKQNLFPLRDGRRRARSHKSDISREEPLLIDPAAQEPATFLGFRQEYVFAVDDCPEGRATIDVLGLNREELAENRRQRLQDLEQLHETYTLLRELVKRAPTPEATTRLSRLEQTLRTKTTAQSEYAAMARAYLAGRI